VAQEGFPSWSPDGQTIVFSRGLRGDTLGITGLWMAPAGGGEPRQLTSYIGEHPDWSPDGNYIVFDADTGNSIKLVAATGGNPIRVVPASIPIFQGGTPRWSPDGSRVAFREGPNLWVLDVRSGEAAIAFTKTGSLPLPGCWSLDGEEIYVQLRGEDPREASIWRVSLTGDKRTLIAADSSYVYRYLDLSPDGTMLAFASFHDDNLDLWIMPAEGGNPIRLTTHPAHDGTPRWSPDGTKIAFTSTRTDNFDVWVMDLDLERVRSALREANN
jgi:Tol biopolymer transport system component